MPRGNDGSTRRIVDVTLKVVTAAQTNGIQPPRPGANSERACSICLRRAGGARHPVAADAARLHRSDPVLVARSRAARRWNHCAGSALRLSANPRSPHRPAALARPTSKAAVTIKAVANGFSRGQRRTRSVRRRLVGPTRPTLPEPPEFVSECRGRRSDVSSPDRHFRQIVTEVATHFRVQSRGADRVFMNHHPLRLGGGLSRETAAGQSASRQSRTAQGVDVRGRPDHPRLPDDLLGSHVAQSADRECRSMLEPPRPSKMPGQGRSRAVLGRALDSSSRMLAGPGSRCTIPARYAHLHGLGQRDQKLRSHTGPAAGGRQGPAAEHSPFEELHREVWTPFMVAHIIDRNDVRPWRRLATATASLEPRAPLGQPRQRTPGDEHLERDRAIEAAVQTPCRRRPCPRDPAGPPGHSLGSRQVANSL